METIHSVTGVITLYQTSGPHIDKKDFLKLVRDTEKAHSWEVLSASGAGCKFVPSKTVFTLAKNREPDIYEVKFRPDDSCLPPSQVVAYIAYAQNLATHIQMAKPADIGGVVRYAVTLAGTSSIPL